MANAGIKKRIREYLDKADDDMLNRISEFIEAEETYVSSLKKTLLDERLLHHRDNPKDGKDWDELFRELSNKYEL